MLKDLMNKAKDVLDDMGVDELSDLKNLTSKPEVKKALNSLISFMEKNDKDTVVKVLKQLIK